MKKLISVGTGIFGAVILTASVCAAAIPQSQLNIGGVSYGASVSDVEKNFGKPTKTKNYGEKIKYKYANDLEFEFVNGKVSEIEVEDFSDAKTSAGIGIGADVSAIERAYGAADLIHKDKYIYYTDDKNLGLVFKIKNGQVQKIKCGFLK